MKLEYVVALAVVQFLVFVAISFFSRAAMPKSGLRAADRNLLISGAVAFFAFIALAAGTSASPAAKASVVKTNDASGSCASVEAGMTADEVREKVGKPDEIRDDAEIRGPEAKTWVYRGSRCAVHLLGDRVEFVE